MEHIQKIVSTFDPISLSEMDSVKLLDRFDTKYAFNFCKLPTLLNKLSSEYFILDIDNIRINPYETLYYDTDNFLLYHQHHSGKLNRYKIRYRRYTETKLSFFEIKFKNNKNRTIKERIKQRSIEQEIVGDAKDFLNKNPILANEDFIPKLWVYYSRITLVNKNSSERLTLDLNLTYSDGIKKVSYPALVIAELKQEKNKNSFFSQLMKEQHIKDSSISKYCFGIVILNNEIKHNNFNEKIKSINKLCHE
ncbi:MAG: polyphosphate polymerase domain-containing protein [Bacteroidota bacterium]